MRASLIILFALSVSAVAETISSETPAAGCIPVELTAGRDNYMSIPVLFRPVGGGAIAGTGSNTISVAGARWTDDEFAPETSGSAPGIPRFYVEFRTGSLAGCHFDILGNSEDTLLLKVSGSSVAQPIGVNAVGTAAIGNVVQVLPYWHVREVFGDSASDPQLLLSPIQTGTVTPGSRVDTVRLYDPGKPGFLNHPTAEWGCFVSEGWKEITTGSGSGVFDLIKPGSGAVVRKAVPGDATLFLVGYVQTLDTVFQMPDSPVDSGCEQVLAIAAADGVTLDQSGLLWDVVSGGVDGRSPSPLERRNEVFLFGLTGFESGPARRFCQLISGNWYELGIGTSGTTELRPGSAFVLKRTPGASGGVWRQRGSY